MLNTYLIFMIVFRTVFSSLSSSCSLYLPMYLFSRHFIICYFGLYTFLMVPLHLHLLPSQGYHHHIWRKQCNIYRWRRQDSRGDIDFSSVYRLHHPHATDLRICIVSDNTGDLSMQYLGASRLVLHDTRWLLRESGYGPDYWYDGCTGTVHAQ